MDPYSTAFNKLCRICLLADNTKMVSLFNDDHTLNHYGHSVNTFSSIFVTYNAELPEKMCIKCLKLLYHATLFKLRCERTQKALNSLSKSEDAKRKIVQYAFYNKFLSNKNKNDGEMDVPSFVLNTSAVSQYSDEDAGPSEIYGEENASQSSDDSDRKLSLIKRKCDKPYNKETDEEREERRLRIQKLLLGRSTRPRAKTKLEERTCEICSKVLSSRASKDAHKLRHFKSSHVCEHCGKCFGSKPELRIHLFVIHKTGQGFPCDKCDFTAPRRFELMEHNRIHTGERPFACETCGKTFRRHYIYMKHLVCHMEKKYLCGKCPRKFARRSSVLAHHNAVHVRLYMYTCHYCGANYAKISTVRKHMQERHGVPREQQGKIGRVQTSNDLYRPYTIIDTPDKSESKNTEIESLNEDTTNLISTM